MPGRKRRVIAVSVAASLSVLLGAGPASGTPSALSGKSAAQILAISLAAARAKGSVHITQTGRFEGKAKTTVLDQSQTSGRELDSGGAGRGEILVVSGVAYVKGTLSYLTNMGFSQLDAAKGAGRWISFHKGQPGYGGVASDETLDQTLSDSVPDQPLTGPGRDDPARPAGVRDHGHRDPGGVGPGHHLRLGHRPVPPGRGGR